MNLNTHLETLRAKPEHIRKRIAFWSAFGITAVIFTFWLSSFSAFSINSSGPSPVAVAVEKAGTPSQNLVASVGGFFNDIKDMIFGPKKVTFSTVEVLPGK